MWKTKPRLMLCQETLGELILFSERYSWSHQNVLVTGALGEIGSVVISRLSEIGANVIGVDLMDSESGSESFNKLLHLGNNNFVRSRYLSTDIRNEVEIESLVSTLENDFPTSVVLLAGIVRSGNLVEQSDLSVHQVIETNLTAQLIFSKKILEVWLRRQIAGNIVMVGSWVGHVPWPGITPYAASKAGLVAASRGIAREYAKFGIRANVIEPGIVNVGMAAHQWKTEEDYRARALRAIPLRRLQEASEVSDGIEFLLSPAAKYMTGATLLLDGGASLYPLDPEDI